MIEVQNLVKSFGTTRALTGVSFAVGAGEIVGLLGPNGAGKTTLVRAMATLLTPDAGTVRVGGFDAVAAPAQVRALIGLAGQFAAVDDVLTGRENLELVARLYGVRRAERQRRVPAVLDRFDLVDVADRRAGTYSGGLRRRLDLAATLVGRPAVILLDEPTAGLDPRSRADLWVLVEQAAADGATVVLTSQHLDEVERLARRIVVIDRGVVIADGSADDLKGAVGGDVIEARVDDPEMLEAARALLADLGAGTATSDPDARTVVVPARAGVPALMAAARRLDEAGIALADLGLRRPSLDDVFFALTGAGAELQPDIPAPPLPPIPTVTRAPASRVAPARRHGASDMAAVTQRYLLRFVRIPPLLFLGTVQPVLFVVMLDAVFGGLVEQAGLGVDYMQYLLPGVLVMSVMFGASITSAGIAEDVQAGVVDRFRSLPMSRAAVLVGRTIADLVRNALALTLVTIVGVAMGYRFAGPGAAVAVAGLLLVFAFAVSWLFAAVGLAVRHPEVAQLAGFLPVLPLVFLSGAWIPIETMPAGLQAFARHQPVNVLVEAVRALGDGAPAAEPVGRSMAWSVAILLIAVPVGVRLYRGDGS